MAGVSESQFLFSLASGRPGLAQETRPIATGDGRSHHGQDLA